MMLAIGTGAGNTSLLPEAFVMINVKWDEDICIHSLDCCTLLPKVFREENDKIVFDLSQGAEDAIRDAVQRCPSGALSIEK